MNRRPLTVAELIDYLQQFEGSTLVFYDYGPWNKSAVDEIHKEGKSYLVLDTLDYHVDLK